MQFPMTQTTILRLTLTFVLAGFLTPLIAQKRDDSDSGLNRAKSLAVLRSIKNNLREHYFDKNLKGIDIDEKANQAEARIKTLKYNWEMHRVLAQFLLDFDDSHTRFLLPPRADNFSFGFEVQMIGNDCVVTSVTSGSDAEKKGLEVGDIVDQIGNYRPTRPDLWKILYVVNVLNTSKDLGLKIVKPDGSARTLLIEAQTRTDKEVRAERDARKAAGEFKPYVCRPINAVVVACKFRSFSVEKPIVSKLMKEVSGYQKLILDLRGNGGGYVVTELHFIGAFFERDVEVANMVTRKKSEMRHAKGWGKDAYQGELAVLIDSRSASAAEIFARVMQLQKRAKIYGDVSSGSVMTSIMLPISSNTDPSMTVYGGQYGMSVTIGDVVMTDGGRLEKVGVKPDFPVIPNQKAIAAGMDPVLALSAVHFGVDLSPETAGTFKFIGQRAGVDETDEN